MSDGLMAEPGSSPHQEGIPFLLLAVFPNSNSLHSLRDRRIPRSAPEWSGGLSAGTRAAPRADMCPQGGRGTGRKPAAQVASVGPVRAEKEPPLTGKVCMRPRAEAPSAQSFMTPSPSGDGVSLMRTAVPTSAHSHPSFLELITKDPQSLRTCPAGGVSAVGAGASIPPRDAGTAPALLL